MTLTEIQQTFVDIGVQYSTALLQGYFKAELGHPAGIDVLETTSMLTDTMEAGILLAGSLSAPATLGASTAVAASIVVLAKTGQKFYNWCRTFSENSQEEYYPDAIKRDIKQLRMQVQLHRAIHQYAVRYAYGLHEVVDKKSLYKFSEQTAERLMKIMLAMMQANRQQIPDAENVLDRLLASAKLSVTKEVNSVTIQESRFIFGPIKSTKMPSKLLWACPIWYVFDEDGIGEFIGSQKEHDFLKTTTLRECGIIALPRDKLQLTSLAVNLSPYRSLTAVDLNEPCDLLVKKLCFHHVVTRFDVENYLQFIRQSAASTPLSLNEYLTELLVKPVIAVCHTNELSHMDLSGGRFSEVDFDNADLSGCNLCDTDWSGRYTWLSKVKFNQVILNERTNFQAVHAEESIWLNVKFGSGINVSLTKFNGAIFIDCVINPGHLLQWGTDWLLASFKNLRVEDRTIDLEHAFQNKLNLERQERLKLEQEINRMNKACEEQSRLIHSTIKQTKTRQPSATELKENVASLKSEQIPLLSEYDARLKQLRERCDLLEKACVRDESAIAELQHFRQEEDERWSEQYNADLLRDQRITLLEPSHSVMNRLVHYCKEEINTTSHRLIKRTYVELKAASILSGKDVELESLTECLDKYLLNADQYILLLHGEQGCGKSTTLKLLFEELLKLCLRELSSYSASHVQPSIYKRPLIPILIDLSQVQDTGRNSLRSGLEYYFDKSQVDYLIEKENCLMMIDNLDVSGVSLQQFLQDCADLSANFIYKPKFILSTKTSYLLSLERNYDEIFMISGLSLDAEYMIHAFDTHQIKRFFSFYQGEVAYQRFQFLEAQNAEIRSMLRSPLMLSIIISAFFSDSFNEENIVFRSDFYEASWHALYEHVRHLLPKSSKLYDEFINMIQQLAIAIFEQGQDWIKHPFEKKLHGQLRRDPLNCLFHAKIKYLLFLSINKKNNELYVRFIHPSLGHYWIAQCLFADLFEKNFSDKQNLRRWNLRSLREFPNVTNFLVELIQKDSDKEALLNRLMYIVTLTRDPAYRPYEIAASNAITIRCCLDKNFNQCDLSDIAIPHADLTEGLFVGTNFSRSNLREVRFVRAVLLWSNMRDADLAKAQFLDAASFIEADGALTVFDVYPSLSETIIAFAVEPKQSFHWYKIALIKVQEGLSHKLTIWPAHVRRILSMAWSVADGVARLASAGEGGTIRVWGFKDNVVNSVEALVRLSDTKQKSPISVLVWGPRGHLIASGSDDGHVSIWDIDTQKKIYQFSISSSLPVSPIRVLSWGNETNVLIAMDDGQVLYLWQDPEKPDPNTRLRQFFLHTIFSQEITPVCSMALSWNEQQIALGQRNGDILMMAIDGSSFRPKVLHGHKRQVNSLCWRSANIISSSADHTVRVWYNAKFSKILQHEYSVRRVELLPSGRELILGMDRLSHRMFFWNIEQPNAERLEFDPLGIITSLSVHHGPQSYTKIAVGFMSGMVMLYVIEKQTQHVTRLLLWEHEHVSVSQLSWSSDGQFLASFCQDGPMVIKNIQTMNAPLLTVQPEGNAGFNAMAWIKKSIYSSFFVIGLSDGCICFYDVTQAVESENGYTLQPVYKIPALSGSSLHCLAVSPADELLSVATIAVARGEYIEIWMIDLNKKNHFVFVNPHSFEHPNGRVTVLAWSPDGNSLASANSHQAIFVWGHSYSCIFEYIIESDIKYIRWCEKWLIVGAKNKIFVWDITVQDAWSRVPICLSVGASVFGEDDSNLILGENRGIWICNREKFFSGEGPASWVMLVKPELLMHQANCSGAQASPPTKELLARKGGIVTGALEKFSLFRSWPKTSPNDILYKLPKPSTREELNHIKLKHLPSHSSMFNEDLTESSSSPSPRVRALSNETTFK